MAFYFTYFRPVSPSHHPRAESTATLISTTLSNTSSTTEPGAPVTSSGWEKKVIVTKAEKYLQQMTESGRQPEDPEARVSLDYSAEETPVELTQGSPQQKYSFLAEISR